MNFASTNRHGSLILPLRNGPKSTPTDIYTSYPTTIERKSSEMPARQTTPIATSTSRFKHSISLPSTANKWFKEPKIPVRLNSSTLIRMKSKNPSTNEVIGDHRTDDQLALNAASFLKRDRRMSDYQVANGTSPFGDNSYVKNVFLDIVSQRNAKAAATPSGDGTHTSATYHRISAISLNDSKFGCNLNIFERVSYEGAASISPSPVDIVSQSKVAVPSSKMGTTFSVRNLNAMLQQSTLAEANNWQKGNHGGTTDDQVETDVEEVEILPRFMGKKKKISRKHRRAIVVTSLKNSSVRYVRKGSSRDS